MEQEHTVCFHVILEKALVFTVDRKELAIEIEKVSFSWMPRPSTSTFDRKHY
jgi:hypothetical protein